MRQIRQPNDTSCGIACAAMLANVSYAEARNAAYQAFEKDEWTTFRTHICDLREVLRHLKLTLGRKISISDWSKVPPHSLVAINYSQKRDTWHWVVSAVIKGQAGVVDSESKKAFRTDFNKMRLAWYHQVYPILEKSSEALVLPHG
jgi:ABC-type bacteriocin/lantibiotic exporter with double-glycine peptidase domain